MIGIVFIIVVTCTGIIFIGVIMALIGEEKCIELLSVIGWAVIIIGLAVGTVSIPSYVLAWKTAEYEAIVINKNFGTNYTTIEFFWGGEAIKNYLYGEKKNFNVKIEGLEVDR